MVEHPLINHLARQATAVELGGKFSHAIAEWTLISRAEAGRRIHEAADLGGRHGLTGEPLAPACAATAAAQVTGNSGLARSRSSGASSSNCPVGSMPPPARRPKPLERGSEPSSA